MSDDSSANRCIPNLTKYNTVTCCFDALFLRICQCLIYFYTLQISNHSIKETSMETKTSIKLPDANQITLSTALGERRNPEDVLQQIQNDPSLKKLYASFDKSAQSDILDILCGNKGLKILYDDFFNHIFNPEQHPERVESLLSAILHQSVSIIKVLSREGLQISEHGSLVVMDIVVQLQDGSITNLEMQKVGYEFPGERTCCYQSDLIMRQYSREKERLKKNFSYRDMRPVQIIILMENSSSVFRAVSPHYIHNKQVYFDSGAQVTDLCPATYISLDIFRDVVQNNIDTRLHAWLTFLCHDEPEMILKLIRTYPDFIPLYQDIAEFRKSPEELMHMFSEALLQMDRNTEKLMVEIFKEERDAALLERDNALQSLDAKDKRIAELEALLAAKQS